MARQTYDDDSQILNNTVVYGAQGRWLAGNGDFLRDNRPAHEWSLFSKTDGTTNWLQYNRLVLLDSTVGYESMTWRFLTWFDGTEDYAKFEILPRAITGGNETLTVAITVYNISDSTTETGNTTFSYADLNGAAADPEEDASLLSYELDLSSSSVIPSQGQDPPVRALYKVALTGNNIGVGDSIDIWAATLYVYTTPVSRSG